MNYSESLDYLFGLGFERSVQKFGLENSISLLNALGNPQQNFIKVQIAGTNGKGSTCAFLESICIAAGISVGLNTSPHLISVTERIRVDGREVSEEGFADWATRVRRAGEELVASGVLPAVPTYFEHITAIAQLAFAEAGVEVAILETGLGGRFDATTAARAEITAITPIDLDHTKTLGSTIAKIAAEKAAIIRPGVAAVIGLQNKEAMRVIADKCRNERVKPRIAADVVCELVQPPRPAGTPPLEGGELLDERKPLVGTPPLKGGELLDERKPLVGSPPFEVGELSDEKNPHVGTPPLEGGELLDERKPLVGSPPSEVGELSDEKNPHVGTPLWEGGELVTFETKEAVYRDVRLSLWGKHQIENATAAVLLAEVLREKGFRISNSDIRKGLQSATHKGRLEYSDGILFDGAHNVAGARALREFLRASVKKRVTMIFGSMSGKDLEQISNILFPLAGHLILTTPENPRAMKASEIAPFAEKVLNKNQISVIDGIPDAVKIAKELTADGLILVTGSLYLIGEIQSYLQDLPSEENA